MIDAFCRDPGLGEARCGGIGGDQRREFGAVIHGRKNDGSFTASSTGKLPLEPQGLVRLSDRMSIDALLDVIDQRLTALKMKDRKACIKAGLHVDAIRNMRRFRRPAHVATLAKLEIALGLSTGTLVDLAANAPPRERASVQLQRVMVRGAVQAGVWREAIEWDGDEWYSVTVPADDRFPGAERHGFEVRGTSMDKIYREGTVVIAVRFGDIMRHPNPGERVICLRRDPNGEGYEATIKEYQIDDKGRHILWPRSNDPEHQTPFILTSADLPVSQDYEPLPKVVHARTYRDVSEPDIVISGLVIGSYSTE